MEIMPAYAHISFELLLSAGLPPSSTVGAPGIHGAGVTGIQGIGVSLPNCSAVADATVGFSSDRHIPNGITLTIGMLSIIVATGLPLDMHLARGSTLSIDGVSPILQYVIAPLTTQKDIPFYYLLRK